MKVNQITQESRFDRRDAYQRDYDSSVSGMGRGDDHRGLRQELAHERNNIQIAINGRPWKVVAGRGTADSAEERSHLESMKQWAERKSTSSGKKWTVYLTGAEVSEGQGVAEAQQLNVQQLATISDEALDKAYGYGRSQPGNSFGWQANLKSAAFAKQMIDQGVTDIEAISDAIHKGWNTTAQAFVQNPEQFDDTAKLAAAGKLEAKLQQRAQLMKQNYGQLPEEEKEKDRVVARALLQALKKQGVAEGDELKKQKHLNELFDAQQEYFKLADGQVIQVDYKQDLNADGQPGTIKIVPVNPKIMPMSGMQAIHPWDKARHNIRTAIQKWVQSGQQGLAEGLTEFAADDGNDGGEDDALRNYARMWWAGDEATQMQIEAALAKMGWEIGEDEGGYDNGGVFVVRAGDENGDSYTSWAAEDLTEGMAEGSKKSEPPEADYGADYQDLVSRVKKLAGMGPLKTVYDPNKRVYRNVPTAVQPPKK